MVYLYPRVLGLVELAVEYGESEEDDNLLLWELDINTDLVIQFMEKISTTASLEDVSMQIFIVSFFSTISSKWVTKTDEQLQFEIGILLLTGLMSIVSIKHCCESLQKRCN